MTKRHDQPSPRPDPPSDTAPVTPRKRVNPLDAPKRRRPKQKRSRETVEAILQGAIRVMERGGFEAFNVHAIAKEAEVNVATLYSYFANKHKLLETLTQNQLNERIAMLEDAFAKAKAAPDWISSICDSIIDLARLRANQAGSVALRQALHASPQLWELDQDGNRIAARMVADLLEQRATPCPANPKLRGRIIAEYVTAILDMKAQFPVQSHAEFDQEMVALLRVHLSMP